MSKTKHPNESAIDKSVRKSNYTGRQLIPSGQFYYKVYEAEDYTLFSDPPSKNRETEEEMRAAIKNKQGFSLSNKEHQDRMKECAQVLRERAQR